MLGRSCMNAQPSALVQQYRESHHAVARMVAAGMTDSMVRRRTGYSQRRLTLMKQDPTFIQLVQDYKGVVFEKINADTDSFAELSIQNMIAAERQISDKLDEADALGVLLPTGELLKIVGDRADRFGYSKRVTQTNINVDIAVALDRAIERSGTVRQIEHQPSLEATQAPSNADVLVGEVEPSQAEPRPPSNTLPHSSVVEHRTLNPRVVGSSPTAATSRLLRPKVLRRV